LKGRDCPDCKKFLDAINHAGDHKFDFVSECSRHKDVHTQPETPEDFWEVGFPSPLKSNNSTRSLGNDADMTPSSLEISKNGDR